MFVKSKLLLSMPYTKFYMFSDLFQFQWRTGGIDHAIMITYIPPLLVDARSLGPLGAIWSEVNWTQQDY